MPQGSRRGTPSAYNVAGLGGPALVTVLTAVSGATVATVVLAATIALALPAVIGPWPVRPPGPERSRTATLRAAADLLVRQPVLRSVTLTTSVAFVGIGGLTIAAAAAARAAGRDGTDAGQVVTAIAVGALLGSMAWTRLRPSGDPVRQVIAATTVTGLVLIAMGLGNWPVVIGGAFVVGVLDAPVLIGTFAARHSSSPLDLRSSVFTVGASLKLAASSLGALAAGWMLATASAGAGLVVIGAIHLTAAGLGVVARGDGAAKRGTEVPRRPAGRPTAP